MRKLIKDLIRRLFEPRPKLIATRKLYHAVFVLVNVRKDSVTLPPLYQWAKTNGEPVGEPHYSVEEADWNFGSWLVVRPGMVDIQQSLFDAEKRMKELIAKIATPVSHDEERRMREKIDAVWLDVQHDRLTHQEGMQRQHDIEDDFAARMRVGS